MTKRSNIKIIVSFILVLSFFFDQNTALIGLIISCLYLIITLINKKFETTIILFVLTYLYTGLKSMSGSAFQFVEVTNQQGDERGTPIFVLPKFFSEINVGIFDLSVPFILSLFFYFYFLFLIFNRPESYKGIPNYIVLIFAIASIPTIIGFIIGTLLEINGSMAATKALFSLTIIFYGYSYGKAKSQEILNIFSLLKNRFIYVLAVLLIIGLMYNHILFIYLGVAASIAVYIMLYERNLYKFLILIVSILLGTYNNTFTILLIPLTSGVLTFFSLKYFSRKMTEFLPKLGLIISLIFLVSILSVPKDKISLKEESTTENRLYNKIYGDRYFVWRSYIEEIKDENIFFVIPKENITLETVYDTEVDVVFGAHNTLIQLLYYFGVFWGSLIFLLLFFLMSKMIQVSWHLPKFIQAIAIGLLSTFIVFGLTGHSIVTHTASLLFWLFVGYLTGLGESFKNNLRMNELKFTQLNNGENELLPKSSI